MLHVKKKCKYDCIFRLNFEFFIFWHFFNLKSTQPNSFTSLSKREAQTEWFCPVRQNYRSLKREHWHLILDGWKWADGFFQSEVLIFLGGCRVLVLGIEQHKLKRLSTLLTSGTLQCSPQWRLDQQKQQQRQEANAPFFFFSLSN